MYYKSEYGYTGSVQTFTVPADGVYMIELWGADGGSSYTKKGGTGGYTKCYLSLNVKTNLYVFVGGGGDAMHTGKGDGEPDPGHGNHDDDHDCIIPGAIQNGGYNGGGAAKACLAGWHSVTGGGMTHISTTNNPAGNTWNASWNPAGTIAVAGGGGGGGNETGGNLVGGDGGGLQGGNGVIGRGGHHNYPFGGTQTTGYRQGCGQPCANTASGGGGWWGGYSAGFTVQTCGDHCCAASAGGGSGYIDSTATVASYTNRMCRGDDASRPANPDNRHLTYYETGHHGYARITLIKN